MQTIFNINLDNYLRELANLPKRSEEEGAMMGQTGMAPFMPQGAPTPAGAPAGAPAPAAAPAPAPEAPPASPNFFDMAVQQEQQNP